MTLDQIEDIEDQHRRAGYTLPFPKIPLSLAQAALKAGMVFEQCKKCKGNGFTGMRLLASPRDMQTLAAAGSQSPLPIQRDRCPDCDGAGGFAR